MSTSLQQVAARAGVSSATVSKILNKTDLRFKPETLRQVQQAAQELGYQANPVARSLREKRTKTLGVMLFHLHNPFFVSVLETLEQQALAAGYQMLLDTTWSNPAAWQSPGLRRRWPVDGILVWSQHQIEIKEFFDERDGLPVVYLGYEGTAPVDAVAFDLAGGQRAALEHLYARGCRRIAYVSPEDPGGLRLSVYEAFCREKDLAREHIRLVPGRGWVVQEMEAGLALARRPQAERPEAVLCYNDALAIGVCHGLRRGGVRIPEEIAVVGFDGTIEGRCLERPLTSVLTPVETLCRAALDLLIRRIERDDQAPAHVQTIPTSLQIGETS